MTDEEIRHKISYIVKVKKDIIEREAGGVSRRPIDVIKTNLIFEMSGIIDELFYKLQNARLRMDYNPRNLKKTICLEDIEGGYKKEETND